MMRGVLGVKRVKGHRAGGSRGIYLVRNTCVALRDTRGSTLNGDRGW